MGNEVLFDELQLSVFVPPDLDEAACDAVRRALESRRFGSDLRRTVRQVIRFYPDLAPVRLRIFR